VSVLAVVIVSHNSRADLERSLPLVSAGEWQVIVVDNASTDGTPAFTHEQFPHVDVLELGENVGYGAACNQGIARASAELVLLLNPDAWPVEDGIERLLRCAERHPGLGAVGPELRAPDGVRQPSAVPFPTRWWLGRPAITSAHSRIPLIRLPTLRGGSKFLVGAALLVRRQAVEQIGGFDPSFFMFYEEVDLCWRLHEAGWGVASCPEAKFVHVGGTSTRRNWAAMYREQLLGHLRFLAKHRGSTEAEHARRLLARAVRVRSWAASGKEAEALRATVGWLMSADATALIEGSTPPPACG
jgi:N-acetylglucosaminyl-diphospho-decaprenol L-rhamnosyltransferase